MVVTTTTPDIPPCIKPTGIDSNNENNPTILNKTSKLEPDSDQINKSSKNIQTQEKPQENGTETEYNKIYHQQYTQKDD